MVSRLICHPFRRLDTEIPACSYRQKFMWYVVADMRQEHVGFAMHWNSGQDTTLGLYVALK